MTLLVKVVTRSPMLLLLSITRSLVGLLSRHCVLQLLSMETKVIALAILKIMTMVLFMPLYLLLIWVFATKLEFRKLIAYKLLVTIGVMDCFFLLQNFAAGILTFLWTEQTLWCLLSTMYGKPSIFDCSLTVVGQVFSTNRSGYLQAVPFLSLVLAFNRLTVMLNLKNKQFIDAVCMTCIAVGWFMFYPLMAILHYGVNTRVLNETSEGMSIVQFKIQFNFEESGYNYAGPESFSNFMGYFGPAMELGAFAFTIAVVAVIYLQKRMYGANFRISPLEVRLIIQGFLITLPLSIVNVCGLHLAEALDEILWFHLFWHILAAFIPVINLAVYIVFNPPARAHMMRILRRENRATKVRTITVNTNRN